MEKNEITTGAVIVIGGSAGSLEVILDITNNLPLFATVIIIIVVHRKIDNDSILEDLVAHKTLYAVKEVEDKDAIIPGTIYIAPPDYHLLIENKDSFSLDSSEKIHYSRPSIDVTFESVAGVFTNRVMGILLSGANADGAAGLACIKEMGGHTLVQNPASAEMSIMPQQAINRNIVDRIAEPAQISEAIVRFITLVS
ncbi:chemotaxis protein CheB [Niastella koreensis]|uniref:protein-glutamate methylesterase n=2 Tax=Niastella koreensis TaxID=354356 RepID=G8T8B1_NIAKG|nr:chemotaxis protein CheB [Niastella koreensis]AEV99081.1 CheB methylesterase [Niastella koreensis GR20-10]OQP43996.1 chemotaxis protein CheB [Niastella koreensis]